MGDFFYFMLQSSLLILLVYVIGKAGRKSLSARARYGLWLVVLARLLVPFFLVPVSWPGSWGLPHPYAVVQEAFGGQQEDGKGQQGDLQSYSGAVPEVLKGQIGPADGKKDAAAEKEDDGAVRAGMTSGRPEGTQQGMASGANGQYIPAQSAGHNGTALAAEGEGKAETANASNGGTDLTWTESVQAQAKSLLLAVQARIPAFFALWLMGCLILGSIFTVQNVRFFRNVQRGAVRVDAPEGWSISGEWDVMETPASQTGRGDHRPPVFYRENLESACLAGLIRPGIYVNDRALQNPETFRMVILHEQMHYRQKEPVWNFFRNLLCVIYWFHPFVWLAALASRRDAELACDEGVIENMNRAERKQYGMVLLDLASTKRTGVLEPTTAINGGKKEITARIRTIAKRQKTKKSVLTAALAVLLVVGMMGCTRVEDSGGENLSEMQGQNSAGENPDNVMSQDTEADRSAEDAKQDPQSGMAEGASQSGINQEEEEGQEGDTAKEEKIPKREALFSAATVLGADGPQLDYVDDEILIFHEYFGLVVFQYADHDSAKEKESGSGFEPGIIDTMDLSSIGCSATQGDSAAAVRVSKDGKQIYLHALGSQDFYRYDRLEQTLYRCSMELWPSEDRLYESAETPEGSTDFNIYDMEEWEVGEVKVGKQLLGQKEDVPVWTEKSSGYMRALRKRFEEADELIVDEGWNGGYRSDLKTVEDLGQEEGRWYKIVCQVDKGGNKVENPYEQEAWFVSADRDAYLSVRRFDELICSWKDLLIYSYDDTVYVTKNDVIDPFFSREKGEDRLSFHAQDDVLCISDETAGTMTFYDEELEVIREYKDVRLADFSENRYCVLDLNTGLYGYLNGLGVEVIPFQYSVAQRFHNGYAAVLVGATAEVYYEDKTVKMFDHVGGCWGIIDAAGNYIIEPSEEYSNSFDREDLAKLTQPNLVDGPVTFSEVDEEGRVKFIVREDGRVLMEGWIVR